MSDASFRILGPLRKAVECAGRPDEYLDEQLVRVAGRLPDLLEDFDVTCAAAVRHHLTPPDGEGAERRQRFAAFAGNVGSELTLARWHGATSTRTERDRS